MSKKGFTLIELLVVIAIIGILASIVLVTFPTAQDRAKNARIQNALSQTRTEMVIMYDDDGNYNNVACAVVGNPCTCAGSTNLENLCTESCQNGGGFAIVLSPAAGNSTAACISSPQNGSGAEAYCVDTSGQAKKIPNGSTCNANGTCP